jgi:hypothetical protein
LKARDISLQRCDVGTLRSVYRLDGRDVTAERSGSIEQGRVLYFECTDTIIEAVKALICVEL